MSNEIFIGSVQSMLKECRCSVAAECAFELNLVDLVTEKVGVKIFTDWYLPANPKDIVHYLQPTSGIQVCNNTGLTRKRIP